MKTWGIAGAALAAVTLSAAGARAQDAQVQAQGQAQGGVQTSTPPVVNSTPVVAPPAAPPSQLGAATTTVVKADADVPDHEKFIGRFAVGYLGLNDLPIAQAPAGNGVPAVQRVATPTIGIRYWFTRLIGLDAGLGIGYAGGSTEVVANNVTTTTDKVGIFGLAAHGGVPLAFAHGKHYSFLVVPEMNIGFTSASINAVGNNPKQDLSGFRFDLGARAGAEIHFGFIGVPELSLQASVGLYFRREAWKWSSGGNSASDGNTTFGTTVQADPWALFTNNISAFYYF